MFGFGKERLHSSEIAKALIKRSAENLNEKLSSFVSGLETISETAGLGAYVSQQISKVPSPHLLYWSYQIALGMIPAKNIFSHKIYENIYRVVGIELIKISADENSWFPTHVLETHQILVSGKDDPITLGISGLLEDLKIIVDEQSARNFGNPESMMRLMVIFASHFPGEFIKSTSKDFKVVL